MMAGEISGYSATFNYLPIIGFSYCIEIYWLFNYLPIIRVPYCVEIYWLLQGSKFGEIWKQLDAINVVI